MRNSSSHIHCNNVHKSCNKLPGSIKSTHHLPSQLSHRHMILTCDADNIWWLAVYYQLFMPCTINVRGAKDGHSMHDSAWIIWEIHENNRYKPRSCKDFERQLHTAWYAGVLLVEFHLVKSALLHRSSENEDTNRGASSSSKRIIMHTSPENECFFIELHSSTSHHLCTCVGINEKE